MEEETVFPEGILRKFAVVKLWPGIKTAEDECISRLKIAANSIGVECVEVSATGQLLTDVCKTISSKDFDFVIHLHYDTPKLYDVHSYVALWNPISFYHEWGYYRCSRNLLSHDDFLSCSSDAADDHVSRLIRNSSTHLPAKFKLYHSTSSIVHPPSLGSYNLFYAGINWEALGKGKSRHQYVLKKLDSTGILKIYGPKIFSGVQVWKGYKSYVCEIPFDGISMLDEISKAGISLVLSSKAHKDSELMSNRLFESVASGALVICDENNFARRYFEDSLLYIDMRLPAEVVCEAIKSHILWAKENKSEALIMIEKAQAIFQSKFTLRKNLLDLYSGHIARKTSLLNMHTVHEAEVINIKVFFLIPVFSKNILESHLKSINIQRFKNFISCIVIDQKAYRLNKEYIDLKLGILTKKVCLKLTDFSLQSIVSSLSSPRKLGLVINELLDEITGFESFIIVGPNEELLSNHLQVLAGSLNLDSNRKCVATAALIKSGQDSIKEVQEEIDFSNPHIPTGLGRFIFRSNIIAKDISIALKHVEKNVVAILVGNEKIKQEIPSTIIINTDYDFAMREWNKEQEVEIMNDYTSGRYLNSYHGFKRIEIGLKLNISALERLIRKYDWLRSQIIALRKQGIFARLKAFNRRFKLFK